MHEDNWMRACVALSRHIDSARMYRNEGEVGDAFRESGLEREEVFISVLTNSTGFARGSLIILFYSYEIQCKDTWISEHYRCNRGISEQLWPG